MNKHWILFGLRLVLGLMIAQSFMYRYPVMVFLFVGSYWIMAINMLIAGLDQIDREKFK